MMDVVNEGEDFDLVVDFADADGDAAVPASVRYRVDDEGTGVELRDWEDAGTAAAEMTLGMEPSDTVIVSEDEDVVPCGPKEYETRVVKVEAIYAGGKVLPKEYRFRVRRSRFG